MTDLDLSIMDSVPTSRRPIERGSMLYFLSRLLVTVSERRVKMYQMRNWRSAWSIIGVSPVNAYELMSSASLEKACSITGDQYTI